MEGKGGGSVTAAQSGPGTTSQDDWLHGARAYGQISDRGRLGTTCNYPGQRGSLSRGIEGKSGGETLAASAGLPEFVAPLSSCW